MGIEIINEKNGSLSFVLNESNVGIANAIRRAILGDVPTLAIEEVEFYDNTSSLYDEVLAHRLSLVPIVTDLKLLNFKGECKCKGEGCPSCQAEFSLKKKGPGEVYSQDLKPTNKTLKAVPGILIAKLGKNQGLELKATASLGRGQDNTKWQPAVVGYKYYPLIEISKECTQCGECAEACPRVVFDVKAGKVKVARERDCILCRACMDVCEFNAITVRGDETRFIYEIESTGSLNPREILKTACDQLRKKAEELTTKL